MQPKLRFADERQNVFADKLKPVSGGKPENSSLSCIGHFACKSTQKNYIKSADADRKKTNSKVQLQMRRVPPINANLIFRFNFWPSDVATRNRKMWKTFNQIPMLIR